MRVDGSDVDGSDVASSLAARIQHMVLVKFDDLRVVLATWRMHVDADREDRTARSRFDARKLHLSELLDGMGHGFHRLVHADHLVHEQHWSIEPLGAGHFLLIDPDGGEHEMRPPMVAAALPHFLPAA